MLEFQEIKGLSMSHGETWGSFVEKLETDGTMKPMQAFRTYSNKYWNPFIFVKGKEYSFIWRVKALKP
jgi:hypothetical protein